jgi:hypothetical protein
MVLGLLSINFWASIKEMPLLSQKFFEVLLFQESGADFDVGVVSLGAVYAMKWF